MFKYLGKFIVEFAEGLWIFLFERRHDHLREEDLEPPYL